MNNYILKQIAEFCDDAPPCREPASLAEHQRRLDDFDARLNRIIGLAHELDKILAGEPHPHTAGTLVDFDIDTCANCGRDIRDTIHRTLI